MGNAFTSGLLVTKKTTISKIRKFPIGGSATVASGEHVTSETVVGSAEQKGDLIIVWADEILELDPDKINEGLLVKVGSNVKKGQIIGEIKHLFGLIHNVCYSPINGVVEIISETTGHVSIREAARSVETFAYIDGNVVEISEQDVTIQSSAGVVQGIFGLGGETCAPIAVVSKNNDIQADDITAAHKNCLIIGARSITLEAIIHAREIGVAGIVVGSIKHSVLDFILGEPIGVAITGQEEIGFTLIITEGFGKIAMAADTLDVLTSFEGCRASFNGTTQIRAGVVRPEIIVSLNIDETTTTSSLAVAKELLIGTSIRIIRSPFFGVIAKVTALPEQPVIIDTEAKVRVLEAKDDDGNLMIVPRANVEIIA